MTMALTQITTGGVDENINIDSNTLKVDGTNNRVGIGTASPNSLLDCAGGNITLTEDTNLIFKNSARDTNRGAIQFTSGGEFRIRYGSLLSEAMRIDSSGRVGIGTTSPGNYSGATTKFTVAASGNSGLNIVSGTSDNGIIRFADGTSGDAAYRGRIEYMHDVDALMLGTAGSERLRIDSSGKINIGTTSATQKVSVGTSASETIGYSVDWTGAGAGQVASFTANTATGEVRIGATNSAGTYFPTFYSNNSERMRIDSSGNVGIGTTSPSRLLTIQSTGNANFCIKSANTGVSQCMFGDTDSDVAGNIAYRHSDNAMTFEVNSSERMRINSSGNVGIGTANPSQQLSIKRTGGQTQVSLISDTNESGAIYFGDTASTNRGVVLYDHSQDAMSLYTTGSERMRISSSGKLTVTGVYNSTTTGGSAVYVESDGDLLRFTSSLKYKTDVETIEDARADAILNCRPVWYRSKCTNDVKTEGAEKSDWGWYGFIAEEVAEIEPRLVNWATKDGVKQEDGSVQSVERDPADYEAEGVRYDNFVPLLVNLVKRQQAAIKTLEAKVAALEAAE